MGVELTEKISIMSDTVGFIGSGIMATGMIKRLTEHSVKVSCWNRSVQNTTEAKSFGAEIFTELPEMMESVRKSGGKLFFMCVSDPKAVDDILNKYDFVK